MTSDLVRCWGDNGQGGLGDGTGINSSVPVSVSGSGYAKIQAGSYFSCALLSNGRVSCWGVNNSGQLGDGTINTSFSPVDVLP